jgi:hypothetical protein
LISLADFEEQKSNTAPEGAKSCLRISSEVKRDSRSGAAARRDRSKISADHNSTTQTRRGVREILFVTFCVSCGHSKKKTRSSQLTQRELPIRHFWLDLFDRCNRYRPLKTDVVRSPACRYCFPRRCEQFRLTESRLGGILTHRLQSSRDET